jgi:hypothetical protein
MEKQDEFVEHTDLGTYLGQIARCLLLRGEMLRGVSQLWLEGETDELVEICSELGIEVSRLGRQLKLLRDHICNNCQMKSVEESVRFEDGQEEKNTQDQCHQYNDQ